LVSSAAWPLLSAFRANWQWLKGSLFALKLCFRCAKALLFFERAFIAILNDSGLLAAILRTFSADAPFQVQRYITKPAFASKTANFCYVFTLFNILSVGTGFSPEPHSNPSNQKETTPSHL
jgi:hypothetical protein